MYDCSISTDRAASSVVDSSLAFRTSKAVILQDLRAEKRLQDLRAEDGIPHTKDGFATRRGLPPTKDGVATSTDSTNKRP
eukprot:6490447-Amphidinium_carterae.8